MKNLIEHTILGLLKKFRVGKRNAITRGKLLRQVNSYLRDPISERELRQAIHDLRQKGEPICSASGRGFWYPANLNEVMETAGELESKGKNMLKTARILKESGVAEMGRQEELFR